MAENNNKSMTDTRKIEIVFQVPKDEDISKFYTSLRHGMEEEGYEECDNCGEFSSQSIAGWTADGGKTWTETSETDFDEFTGTYCPKCASLVIKKN